MDKILKNLTAISLVLLGNLHRLSRLKGLIKVDFAFFSDDADGLLFKTFRLFLSTFDCWTPELILFQPNFLSLNDNLDDRLWSSVLVLMQFTTMQKLSKRNMMCVNFMIEEFWCNWSSFQLFKTRIEGNASLMIPNYYCDTSSKREISSLSHEKKVFENYKNCLIWNFTPKMPKIVPKI